MRHSIEELLAVVYRFYPRGLWSREPGYDDTEEQRRLVAARRQAGADEEIWRNLLRRLRARFPDHEVQNNSIHLPTGTLDACYSGCLWLPFCGPQEKNHKIGLLISFLVPYHVVYSASFIQLGPVSDEDTWHEQVRFSFAEDEAPYARAVTEEIATSFPDSAPMPPEIGQVIVPDVVTALRCMGDARLFDCLFTDNW